MDPLLQSDDSNLTHYAELYLLTLATRAVTLPPEKLIPGNSSH